MKNKILKISVVIILIMTLTMTNFIFLGSSLISYAADNVSTNHKNIEFDAYFKDQNAQKTASIERTADMQETSLYLSVNVNKEGFFTGQVELTDANFTMVSSESAFVRQVTDNKIYFNQMNTGTSTEIEIKIKPINNDVMNINMLNGESKLTLTGIYRDSTEKDINIEATRKINLQLIENNGKENVENTLKVITNKKLKIAGEDKRVLQLSLNMGLKNNNYPIEKIHVKITVPEIDGKMPEVKKDIHLNTMSAFEYKYENGYVEITLKNEVTKKDQILWKKQGNENIILTYIYDADIDLEDVEIVSEEVVTLHNEKELTADAQTMTLTNEETDSTIVVTAKNEEDRIYKGKLYSGIDRTYNSKTTLDVNLANTEEYVAIKEENSKYIVNDQEMDSPIYYQRTTISKKDFNTIFGQDGKIEIYEESGKQLANITNDTKTDENGNFVIDYTETQPSGIQIITSKPIAEGTLEFNHVKVIKASDINIVKTANTISTKIMYTYNNYDEQSQIEKQAKYTKGIKEETQIKMTLEETMTEAKFEINRDSLSTIVSNDIEMKFVLKTDEESKDLYKNPTFTIEFPEQVQNIQINSIDLLYEEELKIANYAVNGSVLTIQMEGEQTAYKAQSVEGANIIVNATIDVNKTSIAQPEVIQVTYTNEKANQYATQETVGKIAKGIEIVAPKDVTAINRIQALNVETMGQEKNTSVSLQRGTESKQVSVDLEIINNNEENIENVYVMGTFPTKTDKNTMNIKVINGISIENATVYYTENENATADISDVENGWTDSIANPENVKKYVIVMDKIDARTIVNGTYVIEIPENLEYNQTATEGYSVTYTKGQARSTNTVNATEITMETGIGPKVETNLTATRSGEELTNTSKVKNGEVIKYTVQVSNVGSEDVTNVNITGEIPEGTMLVEPVNHYEYTGASYYKVVKTDAYKATIESLKKGEVKTITYEVMVGANLSEGTEIRNTAQVQYLDVTQDTNEFSLSSEAGTLRTMVKRVTDRQVDLYEAGSVEYFAIIKNTSTQTLQNVTVKTNKSESLQVARLTLITGMSENEIQDDEIYPVTAGANSKVVETKTESTINEDTQSEAIPYSDEINIGTLEPGEVKVLSYNMTISEMPEKVVDTVNFSITTSDGEREHKSNRWEDEINRFNVDMTMESNTQSKYVKSGDNIIYTIKAKNNSTSQTSGFVIKDEIPTQLTVEQVTVNGEEVKANTNSIEIQKEIPANGEITIIIKTVVNYSAVRTEAETITNRAIATIYGEEIATTSDLNHIIEADINNEEDNQGGNGNEGDNNGDQDNNNGNENNGNENNGDIANGKQMISGLAWYDQNNNGKKDKEEKTLENITAKLLNVETKQFVKNTQGNPLEVTTNENGMYVLDNIPNGKYIVIFTYNDTQYALTKYKTEGISEADNSDVRINELLIGDEKQKVASTDIISIDNENIEDINIGLIELQNFDLKLNKFVNRIVVQNTAGTTTREYNNATTAKIELDAKQMKGSTVIIEYNVVVTNVGEVPGYARNIVDYMPSDLEFSSELNKDWYEKDNTLYTTVFGNDIIQPGESKTVTLTLTKTMGEDNLVTRNTAEIYEDYNDLGLEDGNSTPGNHVNGENDLGSADVIISIRTGGVIYMTIGITVAIIILAGIVAAIIVKRKNMKDEI